MNSFNQGDNRGTIAAKLVLVGESGVGKSSIISRYINDSFGTMYPEMGIFLSKIVSLRPDVPKIKYEIWDTAGQEKYRSITKIYYNDADLILIVFDVSRPCSYDAIKHYWLKEVKNNSKADAMISIVGNKSDLASKVDDDQIKQDAETKGYVYTKTSAKTSDGIKALFAVISEKIIKREEDKEREMIEAQLKKIKPKMKEESFDKEEEKINVKPQMKTEEQHVIIIKETIDELKKNDNVIDEKEEMKNSEMPKAEKEEQIVIPQPDFNNQSLIKTQEDKNDSNNNDNHNQVESNSFIEQNTSNGEDSIVNNSNNNNDSQKKYERTQSVHSILKKNEKETKDDYKTKCC